MFNLTLNMNKYLIIHYSVILRILLRIDKNTLIQHTAAVEIMARR